MKANEPELFEEAVAFDRMIRQRPNLDSETFLHRSLKPLDEIDFQTGQENLFVNDCEGLCGV